jgi:hypothetical protein
MQKQKQAEVGIDKKKEGARKLANIRKMPAVTTRKSLGE